jgi:DNA primase
MTRRGGNYFGLCPFHSEKTPSFSVSTDKQIYHCFGCGAGGGAVHFIMQMESLDYPDAVRFLARRAGMEVEDGAGESQRKKRERILALNREAARFFFDMLSDPRGKEAAEYARRRELKRETVLRFGIGCAPDEWDALIKAMTGKGFDKSELLDAGLVLKNSSGGFYDRFRNRLMFPIINTRGDVVGFGGRVMDDSQPKYLNSRIQPPFIKAKTCSRSTLPRRQNREAYSSEGYMDVISLHQAGFDCAVASLGTSLTEEQARLMARYTKEAVIAYDSDAAGVAAAQRAIGLLGKTGVTVKVLRYSGAKDPDEFIRNVGRKPSHCWWRARKTMSPTGWLSSRPSMT